MKGLKWWFLVISVIMVLAVVGCVPSNPVKPSVAHHIVEVTANNIDTDLEDLADWCDQNNILMLWYDLNTQPPGFTNRNTVFRLAANDKNVYADNQYAGNYDISDLDTIETQIINNLISQLSGTLTLLLRGTDILGTSYDLIIGESGETKGVEITSKYVYVLVEFEEIDSTNHVYKVTKVQVGEDWKNFTVPKNISATELANKGFAFFKIDKIDTDNDKVVDARVIYP